MSDLDTYYDSSDDNFESESSFGNIQLLEHQKITIQYLVSKCKEQKGLLVNHYQGTGKMITGVFFLKNFTNKKVILCPSSLIGQWENAADKINLKIDYFISFEQLEELYDDFNEESFLKIKEIINDSIFVVDEAHNFLKIIENIYPETIQLNDEKKSQKNNKKNKKYKQIFKWFIEMIYSCKKILLLTGTPVLKKLTDIKWLINFAAGKKVVPFLNNEFEELYYKKLDKKTKNALKIALNIMGLDPDIYNSTYIEQQITEYVNHEITISDNKITDKIIKYLAKKIISSLFNYYKDGYSYNSLDLSKISNDNWGKYVSFYKYTNSPYYPEYNTINKSVLYNKYQLDLYYRILDNYNLTDKETVQLGLVDDILEAQLFKPSNFEEEHLSIIGGIIGNLSDNDTPLKFREILKIYINGIPDENMTIPGGYTPLKEENKNILPFTSTLVYSNYYESGLLMFAKYLDKKNVKYTIFEPSLSKHHQKQILEDFKNKKITLLLLHPSYYEGFSISGVRVFHILDPINQYYFKEQLFTRVIRYQSHIHLPMNERHVLIIQWYCTMQNYIDKLRQVNSIFNNTIKNFDFLSIGSSDDILVKNIDKNANYLNDLADTLKSIGIDSSTIPNTCCIYGDESCKLMSCMEN